MPNQAQIEKRAQQLAASADPARNNSAPERAVAEAKLREHCAKHGLDLFAFAPFLRPAEQPEPEAAKPADARADQRAKRDAQRNANQARLDALRTEARAYYSSGASLAVHKAKPAPLDVYASRVLDPVQRAANGATVRDESGLAIILGNVADDGVTFDPVALAIDAGILSRLASLDFVTTDGRTFSLTPAGAERARNVVRKRAA